MNIMKTKKTVTLSIPFFIINKSFSVDHEKIGNWKFISLSMDCNAREYAVISKVEF